MKSFLKKLAEKGWRPHAGQLAYLTAKARFRVLACGRRWGKTDAAAADIASKIVASRTSRQIAIAPTLAQAKIVFDRVRWMLSAAGIAYTTSAAPYPSLQIKEPSENKKEAAVLHVLDARSGHEAKNLRGDGADHILMDEAAFVPESLITEVAMPMLSANAGVMTLISTPRGRNHFYRYFQKGVNGETEFWSRTGPSEENPKVDKSYLDLQKQLLTDSAYRCEYQAEFVTSDSTVFDYDDIEKALSAKRVKRGRVIVGVDWAKSRDYTAVVAVRGTRLQCEVLACDAWNGSSWAALVRKVYRFAEKHKARLLVCDETGLGGPVRSMLTEVSPGIPTKGVHLNSNNKHGFVRNVEWLLENQRLRLPADLALLAELEAYEATETETHVRYAASVGHDDRVVALMLACSELKGGVPVAIRGAYR